MAHLVRLLDIYVHVIDDIEPTRSIVKSSLQSLSAETQQALSPKRRLVAEQKAKERNERSLLLKSGKERLGAFAGMPHYARMYQALKAAHANYSATLEPEASEMYLALLNTCLRVLSQMLELTPANDAAGMTEEVLHYLQTTVALASVESVRGVRQLLKSLFGLNLISRWDQLDGTTSWSSGNNRIDDSDSGSDSGSDKDENEDDEEQPGGFFESCLARPTRDLTETIKSVGSYCRGSGELDSLGGYDISHLKKKEQQQQQAEEKKAVAPGVSLASFKSYVRFSDHKVSMESSIRLFEPMVIKSLTLYTIAQSNSMALQCQVLQLLTQLVQLHINYCLLDSDNIFVDFILKQMELVEEGYISGPTDVLLAHIFDFLVHLSYEMYHSKVVRIDAQ